MEFLWEGLLSITWQQLLMYVVGGLLIWLAIEKGFEPALLLPMGFGAILVNLPLSGVINQFSEGVGETHGIIQWLFEVGIEASEAFPILLFIGIGAMIDFGPLLANPKLFLCGAPHVVRTVFLILSGLLNQGLHIRPKQNQHPVGSPITGLGVIFISRLIQQRDTFIQRIQIFSFVSVRIIHVPGFGILDQQVYDDKDIMVPLGYLFCHGGNVLRKPQIV